VDLASVAADVCESERVRADARHVRIELTVDSGDHRVRGIVPALQRVLSSLVDNALAHTSTLIQVTIDSDPAAGTVSCTVRDDGVGFDPAEAGRLFERFARGSHGDSRRFGLGLALVQEVVHGHGGTAVATGTPGRGAAFTITLPAHRSDPPAPPGQAARPGAPAANQ
jgi:signal transduction histidine kinase